MSLNCATFCYLPPWRVSGAAPFIANLKKFPAAGDLVCYADAGSDHDWPGLIRLKAPVESLKGAEFDEGPHKGKPNAFVYHNALFLVACKIAREQGRSHLLYVESDCRMGQPGWDQQIFEEYFSLGRVCITAGTLSVYNGYSSGRSAALRARQALSLETKHGVPVASYGWTWEHGGVGAKDQAPFCVFPNGALAVYDVHWMGKLFNLDAITHSAKNNGPFDMSIGHALAAQFGEQAYDVTGYLHSAYSGYGDVMTTELERQKLLTDKKVVAVHQFKSDWAP